MAASIVIATVLAYSFMLFNTFQNTDKNVSVAIIISFYIKSARFSTSQNHLSEKAQYSCL